MTATAVLLLTPGVALAQQGPPEEAPPPRPCRPEAYPPEQCRVVGGAGHNAPPLVVGRTVAPAGSSVPVRVASGCVPSGTATLALVRMRTGSAPVGLRTVPTDANGGYDTTVVIPADSQPGVYILYSFCTASGDNDVTVSTSSFVVVPAAAGAARVSGGTASARTSTAAAPVAAEELPQTWTAPAGWTAPAAAKEAVVEAVNLRLAAMRSDLPAVAAPQAAPPAAASPTDLTPWYAAGSAVALLALGAVGLRRRSHASDSTVQEMSA